MNIYIGKNIKALRKEKGLTLEQLAHVLNVSFQAVSKWERGDAYPDIELLPTIAAYFGITIDQLMGMKAIQDTAEAEKIRNTVLENFKKGDIEKNLEILEEAVKRYPNNYTLLDLYTSNLSLVNQDGEAEIKNNLKAAAIAERILSECNDHDIKNRVRGNLSNFYERSGQIDKAIEAVDKLPSIWGSCEINKLPLLKGEEKIKFAQINVTILTQALYLTLMILTDLNAENDKSLTWEQRIEIQQKAIELYNIVFDKGDYNFYTGDISYSNRHIAEMAMLTGDHELAIESLEKAAKYAIEKDNLPNKKPYTSLLVNRLEYDVKNTVKNFTHTYCEELSEKIKSDRYDAIRNEKRFIEIEKMLRDFISGQKIDESN